jgi:predicted MFS family arabinose efflux permease
MAVIAQYRFAVADIVPNLLVSRAIAGLMLGTLIAALVTPWIAMQYRDLLEVDFSGSFAVLPLLYVFAAVIIVCVPIDTERKSQELPHDVQPLGKILSRPAVQLAIACAAIGYGAMSLVMTATPISMHIVDHHSVEATAAVIRGHLLAMFAPSLISGWLIARLGVSRMVLTGLLLNAICIAIAVSGQALWNYQYALIALGIGWNFLFVGGTTLLATACNSEERLRIQGINDFIMFTTMAVAAFSAGALLDGVGWIVTNLIALALLSVIIFFLLRNRFSGRMAT